MICLFKSFDDICPDSLHDTVSNMKKNKKSNKRFLPDNDQNRFLESILDFSEDESAILDSDAYIRYATFGFSALFEEGYRPLRGKHIGEIPELLSLSKSIKNHLSNVIEFETKDNQTCKMKYFTVKDDNQNIAGRFLKVLPKKNSITAEDLDVSHELKTPLHAVFGFSELLKKDSDLTPDQHKLTDKIIYHAKQLNYKIDNIIGVSKKKSSSSDAIINKQKIQKILVVDDVSINRTLLKLMLKRHGLEVQEASNGEDALHILNNWSADMILMDLSMPVMDGIEAVKTIREKNGKSYSAASIIAVTATQQYSREELINYGFDDLMQKPFKEHELLTRLGIEPLN